MKTRAEKIEEAARELAEYLDVWDDDGDALVGMYTAAIHDRADAVLKALALPPAAPDAGADTDISRLRGGPEGPWPDCHDCGRAMVWGRESGPWICPDCVHRRMVRAEAEVREARRFAAAASDKNLTAGAGATQETAPREAGAAGTEPAPALPPAAPGEAREVPLWLANATAGIVDQASKGSFLNAMVRAQRLATECARRFRAVVTERGSDEDQG